MIAALCRKAPFAVRTSAALLILFAGTERIAHQDVASLLVQQPGVAERARTFLLTSPFAALRTATFSLPSPLVGSIPRIPLPDHFEVLKASLPGPARTAASPPPEAEHGEPDVQVIDRTNKSDRMAPKAPTIETLQARTIDESDIDAIRESDLAIAEGIAEIAGDTFAARADWAGTLARSVDRMPASGTLGLVSRLFFGTDKQELPPLAFHHRPLSPAEKLRFAALPGEVLDDGSSVAAKGVVTGEDATLKSPAERLGLAGGTRTKAEKCLADAIYFESRGEPERGQVAVAQVVINRVFSGYYPEDVCGTVYQNAHRHLACQFTFACEGKKLAVNDPRSWERATRISRDMLDGKLWLPEIGKATHYHANWVRPRWVRGMRRIHAIGVHTFYRPRNWEG